MVLVAVAREGQRLVGIPRDLTLRAGDPLLLEGDKLKPENFNYNLDFFDSVALPQSGIRTLISSSIMVLMVVLSALNIMPLLQSAMLAALLMVVFRCLSINQVQNAINWKLLMIFAGSVCLGKAVEATGLSDLLAQTIMSMCGTSALVALVVICTAATFITEFVSNTAAGAMLAPIAIGTAQALGANPITFVIGLMIAVNCSFSSPMGSETHVMIYGPGGYRFSDFARIGIPMNIIMLVANLLIVTTVYPL